jgi:hypothetical protein
MIRELMQRPSPYGKAFSLKFNRERENLIDDGMMMRCSTIDSFRVKYSPISRAFCSRAGYRIHAAAATEFRGTSLEYAKRKERRFKSARNFRIFYFNGSNPAAEAPITMTTLNMYNPDGNSGRKPG